MKTILEYLQKGHIKQQQFNEGDKIVYDDIPCTVILNDNNIVYLMSDLFTSTLGTKPVFHDNSEVNYGNFVFWCWRSGPKIPKSVSDNNWDLPTKTFLDDTNVQQNIIKYVIGDYIFNITHTVWAYDTKKLMVYNLNPNQHYEHDSAGVRFIKKIEI